MLEKGDWGMKITYEQITDDVKINSATGEVVGEESITEIRSILNKKIPNEPDYIKFYKYVNALYAFKGIKTSLTPFIIEISNHRTYAGEGQIVNLNRVTKTMIANNMGVTIKRLDQVISELKNCDILRKIQNGVYSVNPYIVARGSWSDIRKLQMHYDFMTDQMITVANVKDTITGTEIRKAITNTKGQIPGQLTLFDEQTEEVATPDSKNKFNNFPQNQYSKEDFAEMERLFTEN